jgi:hypothetical protein
MNTPAASRQVTRGLPHDERNVLSSSSLTSILDALFLQAQSIDVLATFSMVGWTFAVVDEALCCCNGGGASVFNLFLALAKYTLSLPHHTRADRGRKHICT